jgi:hypothetical protein
MAVRGQMRPDFCLAGAFVAQGSVDGESQIGTPPVEIHERSAFDPESWNDDGADPVLVAVDREIDDEFHLSSRDLRRTLPPPSRALRRLAKQGGSEKNGGE